MSDNYTVYDFNPNNLPQDALAALGLVAACSAHTEQIVQSAIAACISLTPDYAYAVTAHMSSPMRDHVLRAVAEIRIDSLDALDELDEILDNINEAFKLRNDYLHHSFCMHPKNNRLFISKITARGTVKAGLFPKSVSGIRKDAVFIYDAGIILAAFMHDHGLSAPAPDSLAPREHKTKAARKLRRNKILRANPSAKKK